MILRDVFNVMSTSSSLRYDLLFEREGASRCFNAKRNAQQILSARTFQFFDGERVFKEALVAVFLHPLEMLDRFIVLILQE